MRGRYEFDVRPERRHVMYVRVVIYGSGVGVRLVIGAAVSDDGSRMMMMEKEKLMEREKQKRGERENEQRRKHSSEEMNKSGKTGGILRKNSGNNGHYGRDELRFGGKRASRHRNCRKNWKSGIRCARYVECTAWKEVPIRYKIAGGKKHGRLRKEAAGWNSGSGLKITRDVVGAGFRRRYVGGGF